MKKRNFLKSLNILFGSIFVILFACASSKKLADQNTLVDIPRDSSTSNAAVEEEKKMDIQMKEIVAKKSTLAANDNLKDLSRWAVSGDGKQIMLNGQLQNGDCDLFKILLKREGKRSKDFVVNSVGGSSKEGLCIARELQSRKFRKVIVTGVCLGVCAGSIFLSTPQKEFKNGVVGFNGNMTSFTKQSGGFEKILSMVPDQNPTGKPGGSFREMAEKDGRFLLREEKSFLKINGVSQALFDLSTPDEKNSFDYLLPSADTFEKFGVKGVEGEQDLFLNKYLNLKNQVY